MQDLSYILGIGFSGADIWRALIIAFFIAVMVGKKRSVWFLGFIALIADRVVWPIIEMGVAGAGIHSIYASIAALGQTFLDDLGLYVVRYLGLTIMIAGFIAGRARLHALVGAKKAKPAAA